MSSDSRLFDLATVYISAQMSKKEWSEIGLTFRTDQQLYRPVCFVQKLPTWLNRCDSTRFGFYFRLYFLFGFGVSVLFRGWVSHTQGQQLYTNWVTGQTNANGSRPWNREKKGQQQPLTCTTSSASQIKTRHISLLFFFPFFYFIFLFDVGFLPTGTRRLIRHLHSKSEPFSYFAGWK
jgi:hypothetical protein